MSTPPNSTGLSNKQQTILVMIAFALGSFGTVDTSVAVLQGHAELQLILGLVSILAGAISFGIKEGLGIKANAS